MPGICLHFFLEIVLKICLRLLCLGGVVPLPCVQLFSPQFLLGAEYSYGRLTVTFGVLTALCTSAVVSPWPFFITVTAWWLARSLLGLGMPI